ncbi:RloB family protein [Methylomonas sp. DH-1]|uniref:RloB family protein n=1 Tax=Methylomonas sp. (strain DH-1) TaxID=1727196 RepID=UPI0009EE086A|nr:RloB family protein [Methylomonas sp. DH-1]
MPKPRKNRQEQKLKPVLRIYCEGAKTEPNYLQGYIDRFFPTNRLLKVIRIEDTKKNTPKQLVDEAVVAKKVANKSGLNDSFWVVYDRESEIKYSEELHRNAYKKAQRNDVAVVLSNVCFEVWLLLHFQHTAAPYSCYDELRKNSPLRQEFRKRGISDYDKGEKTIFSLFSEQEIQNASRLVKNSKSQVG